MAMRSILALFALCLSLPLHAEDEYEWQAERVHAPLPLYTFEWDDAWPRSYTAPDIIAGCTSRVAFGDWQFLPNPADEFGDPYWLRVSNYGVFHFADWKCVVWGKRVEVRVEIRGCVSRKTTKK